MSGRKYPNVAARILAGLLPAPAPEHCAHLGPCWLWQRALSDAGYGRITVRMDGQPWGFWVHRVSYVLIGGKSIPDGITLDHLCYRKPCANPSHLEPVTRTENSRRQRLRAAMTERLVRQILESAAAVSA